MNQYFHHLRFAAFFLAAVWASCLCCFAEKSDRVRLVEAGVGSVGFRAMAVNSKAHKLYAGQKTGYDPTSGGICVFDMDAQGEVSGNDERVYPVAPSDGEKSSSDILCIRVSTDGRKLYVAREYMAREPLPTVHNTLVVYDLNEKGEPTGKPRGYKSGNPNHAIWDMAVDPRATFLYCVGWGGTGVYAMPLVKGEPSGEPVAFNFGSQGKISIVPSEKWDAFFLGTYPSMVESVNIFPGGEVESPGPGVPFAYKAADAAIYLPISRVGRRLYFAVEGKLFSWPLNSEQKPTDRPQAHPEIKPHSIVTGAHNKLYLILDDAEMDGAGKIVVSNNFRIAQYKPDDKGEPGKPIFESQRFEHQICGCITVDEATELIYVCPTRQ